MDFDIISILVLLFGNGLIVVIANFFFQRNERKSKFDFDARKIAREYYMGLYAHIGRVDERTKNYKNSLKNGNTEIFIFYKHTYEIRTTNEILESYKFEYEQFTSYYIEGINKGYEIFIDDELLENISKFWQTARGFYEKPSDLKDSKKVEKFNYLAEKTTDYMEKLFGLKNRRLFEWEKLRKQIKFG